VCKTCVRLGGTSQLCIVVAFSKAWEPKKQVGLSGVKERTCRRAEVGQSRASGWARWDRDKPAEPRIRGGGSKQLVMCVGGGQH
jgi:hypothetical protein